MHDATVEEINISWLKGNCVFRLRTSATPHSELMFSGISLINIPRQFPWGPSVSINETREIESGCYEIEMQSGDILCICAEEWKFYETTGKKP